MNRLALVIASIALFTAPLAPNLGADQWNKRTILTANEPIQITNKVLEPGKYVMKLMDSPSNRHIVQVFDGTEQHLVTTVLAIPTYRTNPADKTVFTFWETPPGQPKAMRAWFYPGDNFGQEFAQPKLMLVSTASTARSNVPPPPQNESEVTAPPVKEPTEQIQEKPVEEPQQIAQAAPPPTPPEQPAPSPTASAEPAPATLPHTASPLPLIGLAGFLSLGAFAALRLARAS